MTRAGTGKTYASAFALREENPKKVLFLVHREQIAKQAIKSYKKVFGSTKTFGLLSGNQKDYEADYVFSTMQMMAKEDTLSRFQRDEFQTIVIDEAHRVGANSYQNIMNYFEPQFWLGMTASPERTDSYDVYEAFEHNIAYEIRLQQALEENLLCPFHYFGITDLQIDGETIDEETSLKDFNRLTSDERVNYVMEQIQYYGYSGERVKGLVFCSSKKEAAVFSEKFNERGYLTVSLSGEDSQEKRENAIEKLVADEGEKLDYIFTVDIFNEGVDIPEINQVVMLRPTESPIVFVQQLGRGLRKADDKEYVVILDFIGNYKNNFMIPIALSGDKSYDKDIIRRYVREGSRIIPGNSTIHFDEISKERIFRSIDGIKGIKKIIKNSYEQLKGRLGRVPNLMDFYNNGEVDPLIILKEYKTYYHFLQNAEKQFAVKKISDDELLVLEYLSKTIASGKRPHELEILKRVIEDGNFDVDEIARTIEKEYNIGGADEGVEAAISVLQGSFVTNENEKKKFSQIDIITKSSTRRYERMKSFYNRIQKKDFNQYLDDIIELGIARYNNMYKDKINGVFALYEKYSRRDVCHLLNAEKDLSSTMYGMKKIGDDVSIFVTYHKEESLDESEYLQGKPDYADEFVQGSDELFRWDSQIGRGIKSSYINEVCNTKRKHLFIKKSDAEGADFYYMGQFDVFDMREDYKKDNTGRMREITKLVLKLQNPVRPDLLDYLTQN